MKTSLLPLLSLLLGGAVGYGLRTISSGQGVKTVQHGLDEKSTSGMATSAGADSGAQRDETITGSNPSLVEQLKEILLDYDPRSAFKAVKNFSVNELRSALAFIANLPPGRNRDSLRELLYAAWAAHDPQAAWKAALNDPLDIKKGDLLCAVADVFTKKNPLAGIDLALSHPDPFCRSKVLSHVFWSWSREDFVNSLLYANAHPDLPIHEQVFSEALHLMAEKDPLKAADLALSFKAANAHDGMLSSVVRDWATRDPKAAMRWAQSQKNQQLKKMAIASSVSVWAESDPIAALSFVQTLSDWEIRDAAFLQGFWQCSSLRHATPETRAKLESALAMESKLHSGNLKPEELNAHLSMIPEGTFKKELTESMSHAEIRKGKFTQAVELLNTLPDSNGRDRSVVMLGQEWAKSDFSAAAAWLKTQPDSTDRDLALAGYASALAKRDPQAAIDLVETIPDVKLRREAMKNVAYSWYQYDASKADAWMNQSGGFSQTDKNVIRSQASTSNELPLFAPVIGVRR